MRSETQRTIHLGVNFIVAPAPAIDSKHIFAFQARLSEEQIEFAQINRAGHQAVFVRSQPAALQVQVGPAQPAAPIGQLLLISSFGEGPTAEKGGVSEELFRSDAETIALAFRETWPETQQIVVQDAAVRLLYDCGQDHAFQYLWEERLHQGGDALKTFGRPLLGGGVRLVFPPVDGASAKAEVKIESFFGDLRQLFVETTMQWPQSVPIQEMNPNLLLDEALEFATGPTLAFLGSS